MFLVFEFPNLSGNNNNFPAIFNIFVFIQGTRKILIILEALGTLGRAALGQARSIRLVLWHSNPEIEKLLFNYFVGLGGYVCRSMHVLWYMCRGQSEDNMAVCSLLPPYWSQGLN